MLIYLSSPRVIEKTVQLPKVGDMEQTCQEHECATPKSGRCRVRLSKGMTGRREVDRRRGIYAHEPDKKNIDKIKRRKVDRRFVQGRKRGDKGWYRVGRE